MKKRLVDGKWVLWIMLLLWVLVVRSLSGCGVSKEGQEKLRDLEGVVLSEEEIPADLKSAINERKNQPFRLTYSDETYIYLAVGYGKQETGGYSIALRELSLWPGAIHLDTELLGPEPGEGTGSSAAQEDTGGAAPYLVIRTEYREEPVVFQ